MVSTKSMVGLLVLVFVSVDAFPDVDPKFVPIVSQYNEQNADGSFKNGYKAENGIEVEEVGYQKESAGPDKTIQVVQGRSSYTAPDGSRVERTFIADENGYQPSGNDLPVPPPPPPHVIKLLEFLATQPSTPEPLQ